MIVTGRVMENWMILGASDGKSHSVALGHEKIVQRIELFIFVDIVRTAGDMLDTLMFDARIVLNLGNSEPRLLRDGREADKERARRFAVKTLL